MVCYLFYLIAAPFAANLSGEVRARDVMFNPVGFRVQKSHLKAAFGCCWCACVYSEFW